MVWLCCELGGLFVRLRGWGSGRGSGGAVLPAFCEFRAICSFSLEARHVFPRSPPPPTPARTQAERWCSPRPKFHHPGPGGGCGRSTWTGRKWGLGVWDLTVTLTSLNVGFLVGKTEISSQPLRVVVKIQEINRSSLVAQQAKDSTLSLSWLRLALWLGFHPRPRTSAYRDVPSADPCKNKNKKRPAADVYQVVRLFLTAAFETPPISPLNFLSSVKNLDTFY